MTGGIAARFTSERQAVDPGLHSEHGLSLSHACTETAISAAATCRLPG